MIGLDTNILVRLLIEDDSPQTHAAKSFVRKVCTPDEPGYINNIVLAETVWVLQSLYDYDRAAIALALEAVLATPSLRTESSVLVEAALNSYRRYSLGFADALIAEINRAHGCTATATFDRKAARRDGFVGVV